MTSVYWNSWASNRRAYFMSANIINYPATKKEYKREHWNSLLPLETSCIPWLQPPCFWFYHWWDLQLYSQYITLGVSPPAPDIEGNRARTRIRRFMMGWAKIPSFKVHLRNDMNCSWDSVFSTSFEHFLNWQNTISDNSLVTFSWFQFKALQGPC